MITKQELDEIRARLESANHGDAKSDIKKLLDEVSRLERKIERLFDNYSCDNHHASSNPTDWNAE
jgi:predicted nuclease with TOPRIM domain